MPRPLGAGVPVLTSRVSSPPRACACRDEVRTSTDARVIRSCLTDKPFENCGIIPASMPFELQPTLTGALLELRPLRPEDFDDLYAVASDPRIWEQHPVSDRYKEDVFREEFFRGALASGGAFAVIDRATGRIIGSSRYYGLDAAGPEIENGGGVLPPAYLGGAYKPGRKEVMLRDAFPFLKSGVLPVGPGNRRSHAAV